MSVEGAKPTQTLIWNATSKTWEKWDGVLSTGDLSIGAAELKDADTTARANIKAANTARTTATVVLAVQAIDAAGAVLSTSALATSAKQLADGHNVTTKHSITGIADGVKVVASAGTDVALAASTACKRVIIQSQTDNTDIIAVGGTGVDATAATGTGTALYPGEAVDWQIDNLADIYIDSLVSGEGVRFVYFT